MPKAPEIEAKLHELNRKASEAHSRLEKLTAQSTGRGSTDSRALALIEGEGEEGPDPNNEYLRQEIAVAAQVADDYDRAVEIMRGRFAKAQIEDAREKCRAAQPEHRKTVLELIAGLVAASLAMEKEYKLRDDTAFPIPGVTGGILPIMVPTGCQGWLNRREYDSGINRYIRDVVAAGYLTGKEEWLKDFKWTY